MSSPKANSNAPSSKSTGRRLSIFRFPGKLLQARDDSKAAKLASKLKDDSKSSPANNAAENQGGKGKAKKDGNEKLTLEEMLKEGPPDEEDDVDFATMLKEGPRAEDKK